MKWEWVAAGVAGVLFLVLNWVEFPRTPPPPRLTGQERKVYFYCPDDGYEMPGVPEQAKRIMHCPKCGKALKVSLTPPGASSSSVRKARLIALVLMDLTFLLATILFFVTWRRKKQARVVDPEYVYGCRHCGRRIGYRMKHVGIAAKCPVCRRPFIFPVPPEELVT